MLLCYYCDLINKAQFQLRLIVWLEWLLAKYLTKLYTLFFYCLLKYQRISGQLLKHEWRKWRHIHWLVINEISVPSYENLLIINLQLQEFKNNEKLFGGAKSIVWWHMQLSPVKGHWCFIQPPSCAAEVWRQFSFYELMANMSKGEL